MKIHSEGFKVASLGGELTATLAARWERCVLGIGFGKGEVDERGGGLRRCRCRDGETSTSCISEGYMVRGPLDPSIGHQRTFQHITDHHKVEVLEVEGSCHGKMPAARFFFWTPVTLICILYWQSFGSRQAIGINGPRIEGCLE